MREVPWLIVIILCLTLGLAPFNPPHLVEKLQMLFSGTLAKPIDIFDLLLHGAPWILLVVKAAATVRDKRSESVSAQDQEPPDL